MSNFLAVATETPICLRCRLPLLVNSTRRSPFVQSHYQAIHHRSFSIQSRHPQEHAPVRESFAEDQEVLGDAGNYPVGRDDEKDDIRLPSDTNKTKKLAKSGFYFKRAPLYHRDTLDVTTLGKPAEVLRVQDAPPRSYEPKWWLMQPKGKDNPSTKEHLTQSDILENVISERGIISTARAKENIEALKQEWLSELEDPTLAPTESEYYKLGKRLNDGFTIEHLLNYINDATEPVPTDLTDLNRPFRSALLTRTAWRVGMTPFPGDAAQQLETLAAGTRRQKDASSKITYTKSTLAHESKHSKDPIKHTLVNKLIRQFWVVKPREELQAIGELDIQLPKAYQELITSHERNILRQVTDEYDAKIDFSKTEPILRITANQATCASALKLLSLVLGEVASHEISLGEPNKPDTLTSNYRDLLNDLLLREIERLSSTVIRWVEPRETAKSSSQRLLVYYLKNSGKSYKDARRLFEQMLGSVRSRDTSAFYGGTKPAAVKLTATPIEVGQSLPLIERGLAWARKTSASNGKVNRGGDRDQPLEDYVPSSALKAIRRQFQASKCWRTLKKDRFDSSFWKPTPFQQSSAVFGRLLYPAKDAPLAKGLQISSDEFTGHRAFSTEVPGIRRSLERREVKIFKVAEEFRVRMNGAPTLFTKGTRIANIPDLELRFDVQHQEHVQLKDVRLILEDKQADLLLPHEPVDLRFATQIYISAKTQPDPRILEFIKSGNIDKWDPDQNNISHVLTVDLPRRILSPSENLEQADGAEIPINYSIASVERQSIGSARPAQPPGTTQFDLSLSHIHAGPIRGQRQEFCIFDDRALEIIPDLITEKDSQKQDKSSLINCLYTCARDIIGRLRVGSRGEVRPVSKKSLKRTRQIKMGFRGSKKGLDAIERRRSTIVRRRLTDVPLSNRKAEAFTFGRLRQRARIRKVQAAKYDGE